MPRQTKAHRAAVQAAKRPKAIFPMTVTGRFKSRPASRAVQKPTRVRRMATCADDRGKVVRVGDAVAYLSEPHADRLSSSWKVEDQTMRVSRVAYVEREYGTGNPSDPIRVILEDGQRFCGSTAVRPRGFLKLA